MSELGRILVVDDEQPVVEVLREYFASQGYAVESASNGIEALAAVGRQRPDLVLLDIRMPGMDGVEVLRQIGKAGDGIPVIMVTANEDIGLARETLKLGAFDYVAKPFDFGYLDRAVVAAFMHRTARPLPVEGPDGAPAATSWPHFVTTAFRVVRRMRPLGRASTGERLEQAVLDAAREATAGHARQAAEHLAHVQLLVMVAAEMGDLSFADRNALEAAVEAVEKAGLATE